MEKGELLEDVITSFDRSKKGYLDHEEFAGMLRELDFDPALSEPQIDQIIKGVDSDGDGFIMMHELEAAMKATSSMGVRGSPWKMYTDPAQNILCFHNFEENIKIFDYVIREEDLERINRDNYVGEAAYNTRVHAREERAKDWRDFLQDFMATRIQIQVRAFLIRREMAVMKWKNEATIVQTKKAKEFVIRHFVTSHYHGYKSRARFRKQLHCTYEKLWDTERARLFWYNHQTRESSWSEPHLIHRHGDVENPSPWIPVEQPVEGSQDQSEASAPGMDNGSSGDGQYDGVDGTTGLVVSAASSSAYTDDERVVTVPNSDVTAATTSTGTVSTTSDALVVAPSATTTVSYWHVQARRGMPRKPDGLLLCEICSFYFALRKCAECDVKYCFVCHRESHGHPLGFTQKTKPYKVQLNDPSFWTQMDKCAHTWSRVQAVPCGMCGSGPPSNLMAALRCEDCAQNYCRPCHRRFHASSDMLLHQNRVI